MEKQIKAWKEKYGKVVLMIATTANGDTHEFYFKQPDLGVVSAATATAQRDPVAASRMIFKGALLNKENIGFATDREVILGLSPKLQELIDVAEVEVKEL